MKGFLAAVEARVLAEHEQRVIETPYSQLPAYASGRAARNAKLEGRTARQMTREEVLARGRRVAELRAMGEVLADIRVALRCTERQARHAESVYRASLRETGRDE